MTIWDSEIKELDKINENFRDYHPDVYKELAQLSRTSDQNVIMLYSRRCLEVIITNLCETELERPRKTEPLKGIIDKLNSEEKVPAHIITSMLGVNSLSNYGAHPKDFDPAQVKPVLSNLAIVLKWYLKFKDPSLLAKPIEKEKEHVYFTTKVSESEKSIAVLPFKNDSADEENTYFINGIMEEILTNLQMIRELRVLSRTSAEQYRHHTKSIPEIAKELGVNYIVEGSAQKYVNHFRLRVQLIMADKESHLWAKSYQEEILDVKDIFSIQSQIAEAIAAELHAAVTPQEKKLIEKIPTKNLEAYNSYIKGQFYARKLTAEDLETAMQYFETAKTLDPDFALAYVGIGEVWLARQLAGICPPAEAGPMAEKAITNALELDPNIAEVHRALACRKVWSNWDWEGGEAEFKKAIDLNPNDAEAHMFYSHLLNILGRKDEAKRESDIAINLDPINPYNQMLYGMNLFFERRYDDAIKVQQDTLKKNPSDPFAGGQLAYSLFLAGRLNESLDMWKKVFPIPEVVKAYDLGFKKGGFFEAINQGTDALLKAIPNLPPETVAELYIMAGNKEHTLVWLNKAFEAHDPNLTYLRSPVYDSLHDDPYFQDLLRKMNIPFN
jgi:TolB-like protein